MTGGTTAPVAVAKHDDPLRRAASRGGSSVASSGAGLPSALLTPRGSRSTLDGDPLLDDPLLPPLAAAGGDGSDGGSGGDAPSGSGSCSGCEGGGGGGSGGEPAAAQPTARTSSSGRAVHWADERTGAAAPAAAAVRPPLLHSAAPDDPSSGSGGGTATGGRDGVAVGGAAAAAARRAPLPESGCAQLDKYLLYLLKGDHPHKFMCGASTARGAPRPAAPPVPGPRMGAGVRPAAGRGGRACASSPGAAARPASHRGAAAPNDPAPTLPLTKLALPGPPRYYPGWGLSDDACAAVGEFLRIDRRIRVAALSGNRVTNEGAHWARGAPRVGPLGRGVGRRRRSPGDELRGRRDALWQGRSWVGPARQTPGLGCGQQPAAAQSKVGPRQKPAASRRERPAPPPPTPPSHPSGVDQIAQGLAANRTLAALDLSDNRIGDAGALSLATALGSGACVLGELNLSNNCIGARRGGGEGWGPHRQPGLPIDRGKAQAAAPSAGTAGNCRPLDAPAPQGCSPPHPVVDCAATICPAGDEGAEALAAAAASCHHLKKLHIGGNAISGAQQRVVQRALTKREYKV
jgi:hypothetical protein